MADLKTEGRFDRVRGRARSIWGDVTDDDAQKAEGDTENFIGRIKERTGEAMEDIKRKLGDVLDGADDDRDRDRDTGLQ